MLALLALELPLLLLHTTSTWSEKKNKEIKEKKKKEETESNRRLQNRGSQSINKQQRIKGKNHHGSR